MATLTTVAVVPAGLSPVVSSSGCTVCVPKDLCTFVTVVRAPPAAVAASLPMLTDSVTVAVSHVSPVGPVHAAHDGAS